MKPTCHHEKIVVLLIFSKGPIQTYVKNNTHKYLFMLACITVGEFGYKNFNIQFNLLKYQLAIFYLFNLILILVSYI